MMKYFARYKFLQKIAMWSPVGCVGYIVGAATTMSSHSLGFNMGITLASVALGPSGYFATVGYKIKNIPKGWQINILNESTYKDGRAYKHEIRDAEGEILLPFAQSDEHSRPVFSLVAAASDVNRIKIAKQHGNIESFRPGLPPSRQLSAAKLKELDEIIAQPPSAYDLGEEINAEPADNRRL